MTDEGVDNGRRRLLVWSTSAVGAVGAVGIAVPFVRSWDPSAKAQAAGAPVEVNVGKLAEGQYVRAEWRGKPIFVVRRSAASIQKLNGLAGQLKDPESADSEQQPEYVNKTLRSIKDEFVVLIGLCTHLGCVPQFKTELSPVEGGGFFCPCHGSKFDLAGRVFNAVPASKNLEVPPYSFSGENTILIGVDEGAA